MEDETRWMMQNSLTTETTVPNYMDHIYQEGLLAVRPDAVQIIP